MKKHDRLIAAALGISPLMASGQECQPFWIGVPGAPWGSIVAFDDGAGARIYCDPYEIGSYNSVNPVKRWNGSTFEVTGPGLTVGTVDYGFSIFDDGGGKGLHRISALPGGRREMRRLTEEGWKPVPKAMFNVPMPEERSEWIVPRFSTDMPGIAGLYGTIREWNPGSYVVARWGGTGWIKLKGTSPTNIIECLGAYTHEGRPNLVVAGLFWQFAGMDVQHAVRWDGERWHAMGAAPGVAVAMTTWDDGDGEALYMVFAGHSSGYGQLGKEGIARWNGRTWESVGGGLYGAQSQTAWVRDMVVFDDGTGPALFVGGEFDHAGGANGVPARNIARWDGHQWHALGAGCGIVKHLAVADDGRGPSLFVANVTSAGGGTVTNLAQWVGCAGNRQCYADCDNNRVLNANDFQCFINRFAARDPYANCDLNTFTPAITAGDFQCYMNKFAEGCGR